VNNRYKQIAMVMRDESWVLLCDLF